MAGECGSIRNRQKTHAFSAVPRQKAGQIDRIAYLDGLSARKVN